MEIQKFMDIVDSGFCTGVPDSQLKALCDYLVEQYGISREHIIAANEGNCVALAAGFYLATGKVPIVYLQNSGIGNIINPVASLLNENIYGIPCIFIIGWRGEPGTHDEPQHLFQGEITERLLEDIGLHIVMLNDKKTSEELYVELEKSKSILGKGKSIAFLVSKNFFAFSSKESYRNAYTVVREKAIEMIVNVAEEDVIVSTTGKASRELYEIRKQRGDSHKYDFLTVGSMGHSSSIALGIALYKPYTKIWCIDGDGAVLMHMGAMALIGSRKPDNMVHVVMNNEAHESVGGMPTAISENNLTEIAKGCGYNYAACVRTYEELETQLQIVKAQNQLSFIEIKCAIGSRADLGRPSVSPMQSKQEFMEYLKDKR